MTIDYVRCHCVVAIAVAVAIVAVVAVVAIVAIVAIVAAVVLQSSLTMLDVTATLASPSSTT